MLVTRADEEPQQGGRTMSLANFSPCDARSLPGNSAPFLMQLQDLTLESIDVYGGTQTRVKTDDEAIASYAQEMKEGTVFPPITVFFDGATYWLADGFHRYLAAKRNGQATVRAEVQSGGRSDALRYALGANSTNGVYRNNADKRNAVEIALEEWPDLANPVLAEICKVSVELVRRCRQEMVQSQRITPPNTVTGRDGKSYPTQIEREPRGKSEKPSSEGSGGGRGGFSKGKGDPGATGGTNIELEREARAMIRKGEMNPFELPTLLTATAHDYAETVITLLGTMKPDDPKRTEGLNRIKRWVEKALAGEIEVVLPETEMPEPIQDQTPEEPVAP